MTSDKYGTIELFPLHPSIRTLSMRHTQGRMRREKGTAPEPTTGAEKTSQSATSSFTSEATELRIMPRIRGTSTDLVFLYGRRYFKSLAGSDRPESR